MLMIHTLFCGQEICGPLVEVTKLSRHSLWLLAAGRELLLSYAEFPWFKDAPVSAIFNVEEPSSGHFFWPHLDVDLGVESIEHPERFPLEYEDGGYGRVPVADLSQ